MTKILMMFLSAVLFSGCMQTQQQRMAAHNHECISYGFLPGTPENAECRLMLRMHDDQMGLVQGQRQFDAGMYLLHQSQPRLYP